MSDVIGYVVLRDAKPMRMKNNIITLYASEGHTRAAVRQRQDEECYALYGTELVVRAVGVLDDAEAL